VISLEYCTDVVGAARGVAKQRIDQFLHGVGALQNVPNTACARAVIWQLPFLTGRLFDPATIAAIITSRRRDPRDTTGPEKAETV
jgi:hypothetical protein